MITADERRQALRVARHSLETARAELMGVADFLEDRLPTEKDRVMSAEYGRICRAVGVLESQTAVISEQYTKIK